MRVRTVVALCAALGSTLTACSAGTAEPRASHTSTVRAASVAGTTTPASTSPSATPTTTSAPAVTPAPTSLPPSPVASRAVRTPPPSSTAPAPARLPLRLPTGTATQVITVAAASHASTTATLQAWHGSPGHWTRVGPAVPAWLGTDGVGTASEQTTTTPQGSYTLSEAFGRLPDPGTALPYRQTTPADWWISQPGSLYNTEQHCSSGCPFTQGPPNEQLWAAVPYYEYAVVIDYNRDPVRQGAGSAFFLHVTVGAPTQGCISIARDQLVRILRWLQPGQHPRILIGVR